MIFPRNGCASWPSNISRRRRSAEIEKLGFEKLMETLAPAPRRAEGAPSGRLEMDRHGGTSPFGAYGDHPEGRAHRPGQGPPRQRGQSLGPARVQGFRRRRGARAAQHPHRAAAPAPLRARGRRGGARSRRHHPLAPPTRATSTCKLRPERRNAVKVLLFLDVGGSMDWHVEAAEGAVLGGAAAVQAAGAFLLPQLPLRERVEATTAAASTSARRPPTSSTPTAATTASSSSATPR